MSQVQLDWSHQRVKVQFHKALQIRWKPQKYSSMSHPQSQKGINAVCGRLKDQNGREYRPVIQYKQLKNSHLQMYMLPTTLPETNIAPENKLSQKETSIPTIHFQVLY